MENKIKRISNKTVRTNTNLIEPGHYLSEIQYYKVKNIGKGGVVIVNNNETGTEFGIARHMVEEGIYSANQFSKVQELNLKDFINKFLKVGETVFTINFQHLYGLKELKELVSKKLPVKEENDIEEFAIDILNGKEKTIIGYLMDYLEPLGKSVIVDLESDNEEKFLMVDHSRINWFIYKNVKYVVNDTQSII